MSDVAGVFSVPDSVNFDAGSLTATLDIDITKLELETVYDLIISIPVDNSYLYKASSVASSKLSCHLKALKQKWNDAGTCDIMDTFWAEDPGLAEGLKVQNHEGTSDYRILAPYAAMYPADFPDGSPNFLFSIEQDEDENNVVVPTHGQDFWGYGTAMNFYYNPDDYPQYCFVEDIFNEGEHTFDIGFIAAVNGAPYYLGEIIFTWHDCPVEFPEPAADEGEGGEGGEE